MRTSGLFYESLRALIPALPPSEMVRELTLRLTPDAVPWLEVVFYPDLPVSGITVTRTFRLEEE